MSDKEIAKEILFKAIEQDCITIDEFPEAQTSLDAICEAYKKILNVVKEN